MGLASGFSPLDCNRKIETMLHFLNGSIDISHALAGSYDPGQVFISFIVAALASYAGLLMSVRIDDSVNTLTRWLWLGAGSLTMGIGVWAMHFLGMLAFVLPIPVTYDLTLTVLSVFPAIFASAVALHVIGSN